MPVKFENQMARIDCSGLVPGLYWVQFFDKTSGTQAVLKFVKTAN
jgi:hypothetical protein